ncbi:hypothetical protein B0H14DRAFT_2617559 [Mycena olivaceomarginata]|nr:hypothetical protein B0H14DRAFT_2617559 [Mycena olivaceomarginata]
MAWTLLSVVSNNFLFFLLFCFFFFLASPLPVAAVARNLPCKPLATNFACRQRSLDPPSNLVDAQHRLVFLYPQRVKSVFNAPQRASTRLDTLRASTTLTCQSGCVRDVKRATFVWHVEDIDLFSINYIYFGVPKFWYAVPQARAGALEDTMRCPQFLQYKSFLANLTLLAPSALARRGSSSLQQHKPTQTHPNPEAAVKRSPRKRKPTTPFEIEPDAKRVRTVSASSSSHSRAQPEPITINLPARPLAPAPYTSSSLSFHAHPQHHAYAHALAQKLTL